ncbi:MAG: RepB family DNA primase [Bryobacteraceae bacterium]|nr:RepB family DNA primase [Bryobacteraceae bacterium]
MKSRTLVAVEQQINAMGCEVYEIGLFKPHVPGSDSKEPEMLPRTWDGATLLKSVPWLRYQNSQGRNIYIRPSGEHHLSMVDDLTADAVKRMRAEGFGPTLVVETSPGNFQAWLNHGQILPQRISTIAARTLATNFGGDKGAADWRHFGRLAGFTNRKAKYQSQDGAYPFVRIIDARSAHVYAAAGEFVADVREAVASLENPTRAAAGARSNRRLLSIDDFRSNPSYDGDGNRIDLAYSVYALAHGVSEAAIAEAINSRDLSKKGAPSRQSAYTTRTITKAAQRIHGPNSR